MRRYINQLIRGDFMLFFNNLVLNLQHSQYTPFLFNLTSFRRRLLSDEEFLAIKAMVEKKEKPELFTPFERDVYKTLVEEKQILGRDILNIVDAQLYRKFKNNHTKFYNSTDLSIAVQITQECNMDCSYCYEKKYLKEKKTINKEMIDNIERFFYLASDEAGESFNIESLRITGGEPLFNTETVELINYCAFKWPKAKITIQTNGINILNYYNLLPFGHIDNMIISLDGKLEEHMSRRFSGKAVDNSIYRKIIDGIKQLLYDGRKVSISTVIDKTNYKIYAEFQEFLKNEGILGNVLFTQKWGVR